MKCIKEDPIVLFESFILLKHMLIGPLFPHYPKLPGYADFRVFCDFLIIIMTLSLGLFYYMKRDKEILNNKILFLLSVPFFIALANYLFHPTQRYYVLAHFAVILLFFSILPYIKKYKKQIGDYALITILIILTIFFGRFI